MLNLTEVGFCDIWSSQNVSLLVVTSTQLLFFDFDHKKQLWKLKINISSYATRMISQKKYSKLEFITHYSRKITNAEINH